MLCIVWAAKEKERLLDFLNEEGRWYEKFEEHDTPNQDLANGGGKRFLERIEGLSAADLLKELEPQGTSHQSTSFLQSPSSMLSEEITRMAQTELQSCETEGQKPDEIKDVSSDELLSDEDDEQINSIGMHKKIYRNIKYDFFMPSLKRLTLFSIRRTLERNKLFNPKSTGLFLLVQHLGGGVFSTLLSKIRSRHLKKLKFTGLLVYVMFYKICKFESLAIINDVIMTSLPKTMAKFGILQ